MNPPQLQEPEECVHTFPFWDNGRRFMKLVDSSEFEYEDLMASEGYRHEKIEMSSTGRFRYCACVTCDTCEAVISGRDTYLTVISQTTVCKSLLFLYFVSRYIHISSTI